jgi:tRNA modification GTPase
MQPTDANSGATPTDTIVAPASPPGAGGVAVVRLSGPLVETIAAAMLDRLPRPRYATLSTFKDAAGQPVDTGIALYFPAPASYTGESVLELQGHGGPVVVSMLVEAALDLGARRAEPGEFSRRAFLNHKLDLAQAEAVADLIDSGTRQAARAALRSLSGAFSDAVDDLRDQLIDLRTYVEAAIDFPEEEIDFLSDEELERRIGQCQATYRVLIAAAEGGRVLRDGLQLVIVGKPNAGKSSLLNLLSGEDAAIVTDIAGTTRDVLRERISLDGLAVELVDTAGLREDPDVIEAEGIRRAKAALERADGALWVIDAGADAAASAAPSELPAGLATIIVRNKIDLTGESPGQQDGHVNVSATTGAGIHALKAAIKSMAGYAGAGEGAFTARQRHIDSLRASKRHFEAGVDALRAARAGELLAEELRLSMQALGEITGEFSSEDLLGRIFASFCIGK